MTTRCSHGTLAVVPVDENPDATDVAAAPDGPVQVWDLRALESRTVEPLGTVLAVAISPRVLAVLVKRGKSVRIDAFDPKTGASLRSVTVPATVAHRVPVAGTRIVYGVGKQIWLLDATSGKRARIATASGTPLGLSIEGPRVAWGENVAGRGRIRALQLAR